MKAPGRWAGMCATLLVLAAPVMILFGVIGFISPAEGEAPDRLFGGGLIAALGAAVTGVLLLASGLLRPEGRRWRWRMAAFVCAVITVLIGPVWGIGSYLWVVNAGA